VNSCSFKTKYWNYETQKETDFECINQKQSNSENCIFHDLEFLKDKQNHETIRIQFEGIISKYTSSINNEPLFCIGYNLREVNINGKEFPNSVYFNQACFSGSLAINCTFQNNVSFDNAKFSGEGDVNFWAQCLGKGDVNFQKAEFSKQGDVNFSGARFSGKRHVKFQNARFSGKGDVKFSKGATYHSMTPNCLKKFRSSFLVLCSPMKA